MPPEWGSAPAQPRTQPSCWLHGGQGPSSLTLRLPDGFFPRTEAVTKLHFEPSGNHEDKPITSAQASVLCRRAPGPWSPGGFPALSVKQALVAGAPWGCSGSPVTGMTEGPDTKR